MKRKLNLMSKSGSEIYAVSVPNDLLRFLRFDFMPFYEECVKLYGLYSTTGAFDIEQTSKLRSSIKTCMGYVNNNIRGVFSSIVTDCIIFFAARKNQSSYTELWNNHLNASNDYERVIFSRLSEYRNNRAVNQWDNIMRAREYAAEKIEFVFGRVCESPAIAGGRANAFDLMFNIAANEIGYDTSKLPGNSVYALGRAPESPFIFGSVSNEIRKSVLPDVAMRDIPEISPYADAQIYENAAMDAWSKIKKSLPPSNDPFVSALISHISGIPKKIYIPSGLKAVIDLEIDTLIETGGVLQKCELCGEYYVRDADYDFNFCERTGRDGNTCLDAAREEELLGAYPRPTPFSEYSPVITKTSFAEVEKGIEKPPKEGVQLSIKDAASLSEKSEELYKEMSKRLSAEQPPSLRMTQRDLSEWNKELSNLCDEIIAGGREVSEFEKFAETSRVRKFTQLGNNNNIINFSELKKEKEKQDNHPSTNTNSIDPISTISAHKKPDDVYIPSEPQKYNFPTITSQPSQTNTPSLATGKLTQSFNPVTPPKTKVIRAGGNTAASNISHAVDIPISDRGSGENPRLRIENAQKLMNGDVEVPPEIARHLQNKKSRLIPKPKILREKTSEFLNSTDTRPFNAAEYIDEDNFAPVLPIKIPERKNISEYRKTENINDYSGEIDVNTIKRERTTPLGRNTNPSYNSKPERPSKQQRSPQPSQLVSARKSISDKNPPPMANSKYGKATAAYGKAASSYNTRGNLSGKAGQFPNLKDSFSAEIELLKGIESTATSDNSEEFEDIHFPRNQRKRMQKQPFYNDDNDYGEQPEFPDYNDDDDNDDDKYYDDLDENYDYGDGVEDDRYEKEYTYEERPKSQPQSRQKVTQRTHTVPQINVNPTVRNRRQPTQSPAHKINRRTSAIDDTGDVDFGAVIAGIKRDDGFLKSNTDRRPLSDKRSLSEDNIPLDSKGLPSSHLTSRLLKTIISPTKQINDVDDD